MPILKQAAMQSFVTAYALEVLLHSVVSSGIQYGNQRPQFGVAIGGHRRSV